MGEGKVEEQTSRSDRAVVELKIEYRRMDTFVEDYTKNLSQGGTFIKTNNPLDPGTRCLFSLYLPRHLKPLQLKGDVVWVNRPTDIDHPAGDTRGMGISFVFDDETEELEFANEVKKIVAEQLGPEAASRLEDSE